MQQDIQNKVVTTEEGHTFYFAFNRANIALNDFSIYLVEFKFPKALDKTWVLARRRLHNNNNNEIELGNEIQSRGRRTYLWQPLDKTQFNLPGCTGNIKPYKPV